MATAVTFHEFYNHLGSKVHNLGSDTIKVMLSNTAPNAANNTIKSDITEISAGNGYTAGGATAGSVAFTETGANEGKWRFTFADVVFTASGGSIGPFRYVVVYNDTPTSPADPLICYLDYGSSITVTSGNTFTVDVGSDGVVVLGAGTLS